MAVGTVRRASGHSAEAVGDEKEGERAVAEETPGR